MEGIVKAATDLIAALLSALGFVGRARRRENIKQDLALLDDLERRPEIGRGNAPHSTLEAHIALEVGRLAGIKFGTRRIDWGSVFLALVIGSATAYVTYRLNRDGFDIWSLLPGLTAAIMLLGVVGMLTETPTKSSEDSDG